VNLSQTTEKCATISLSITIYYIQGESGGNGRNSMSVFTCVNNVKDTICSYPIFICFQVIKSVIKNFI
jgi:hypothetical protein